METMNRLKRAKKFKVYLLKMDSFMDFFKRVSFSDSFSGSFAYKTNFYHPTKVTFLALC